MSSCRVYGGQFGLICTRCRESQGQPESPLGASSRPEEIPERGGCKGCPRKCIKSPKCLCSPVSDSRNLPSGHDHRCMSVFSYNINSILLTRENGQWPKCPPVYLRHMCMRRVCSSSDSLPLLKVYCSQRSPLCVHLLACCYLFSETFTQDSGVWSVPVPAPCSRKPNPRRVSTPTPGTPLSAGSMNSSVPIPLPRSWMMG